MTGLGLGYLSMKFQKFSFICLDITSLTNVLVEKNVVFRYVFCVPVSQKFMDHTETHKRGRLGCYLPEVFNQVMSSEPPGAVKLTHTDDGFFQLENGKSAKCRSLVGQLG